MKKIILPIFCALFVLALSVSVVLARDGESSGSSRNTSPKPNTGRLGLPDTKNLRDAQEQELKADKAKFEQERQKKIEEFKNKREDLKKKLEQDKKDLKDKRFEKVVMRFEKITGERREALARLDLIVSKIQSRIDKLKASGTDVAAMQAALSACSTTKAAASKAISDSEASVSSIDFNATNAKELAQAQVNAIHTSNQALKSYHSCLTGVISRAPKASGKGTTDSAQ